MPRARIGIRARWLAPMAGLLLGACVTTYEDTPLFGNVNLQRPEFAVLQTIPLGDASASEAERPMLELYNSVLKRLQQAVEERDLPAVEGLLSSYERANLPPALLGQLQGYRSIAHAMAFQRHAAAASTLKLVAPGGEAVADAPAVELAAPPPIGDPVRFEFALPAPQKPVRLGGREDEDPVGFAVAMTIEDLYVDGGTRKNTNQEFVWIPQTIELKGGVTLRLPIVLDLPALDAVQRTVHIRIDLMPGYIQAGGGRAPLQRTSVAATSFTQWPKGHKAIAKNPLANLREAIRLGDAAHFAHVFLAASFTTGAERDVALALLIDQVRLGSQAQAMVAMATLRSLTGMTESVGDREAWLAWWQLRR
jgi:hypothetical protein